MKTLLLLRHAKSSWKDPTLDDHDRPLKKRGKNAAPMMGKLLKKERLVPQIIFSSTARRARDTALLAAEAAGFKGEIRFESAIYLAEPETMLGLLVDVPDVDRIMIVAHNPGLEVLIEELTGKSVRFPTAALAEIRLGADSWSDVKPSSEGKLKNLWRAREL